jgi:hypothetical protein
LHQVFLKHEENAAGIPDFDEPSFAVCAVDHDQNPFWHLITMSLLTAAVNGDSSFAETIGPLHVQHDESPFPFAVIAV